jgi:hypothetical protein
MRSDFCVFILTHGRPDRVYTFETLQKAGYTGRLYLVIDDEDETADEYRERFGDRVLQFSKAEIAATFDEGQNAGDRRAIVYARNACWELAERVGVRYFVQYDDDYSGFYIRFDSRGRYGSNRVKSTMDDLLSALVEFYEATPALTLAISQGGDHIGGEPKSIRMTRKAMNSFICSVDRPFKFRGRVNEDVNTYTSEARRGSLFLTVMQAQLNQKATQSNAGGMTDLYLDSGTYVKSAFSVLYCPSGVRIGELADPRSPHARIHHKILWPFVAPKIVRESVRRPSPASSAPSAED